MAHFFLQSDRNVPGVLDEAKRLTQRAAIMMNVQYVILAQISLLLILGTACVV